MKPEQFIREFGEKKAREVVEGAPLMAELYSSRGYIKNAHSEGETDYFARWSSGAKCWIGDEDSESLVDDSVDLSGLKRLVDSLDIIDALEGIKGAKGTLYNLIQLEWDEFEHRYIDNWTCTKERLEHAIRDHESIYGGGDES
ncbi:hypothetical protein OHW69_08165 [Acinetobacter baumannii]|nr:hypothetical protein [Acinetobacter baumannii]